MLVYRVRLSKRRKTAGSTVAKSRLVVKHRGLNDKELRAQVQFRCQNYLYIYRQAWAKRQTVKWNGLDLLSCVQSCSTCYKFQKKYYKIQFKYSCEKFQHISQRQSVQKQSSDIELSLLAYIFVQPVNAFKNDSLLLLWQKGTKSCSELL